MPATGWLKRHARQPLVNGAVPCLVLKKDTLPHFKTVAFLPCFQGFRALLMKEGIVPDDF